MGKLADFFREQSITLAGQQKAKMLSLDREFEALKAERDALKAENLNLHAEMNPAKREIERLQQQIQHSGSQMNPRGYNCDHCNSAKLKRTGSRPHKHFGVMGIKDAIFSCLDCGKESVFREDPNG